MYQCKKCYRLVEDDKTVCPYCGATHSDDEADLYIARVDAEKKQQRAKILVVLAVIAIGIIILIGYSVKQSRIKNDAETQRAEYITKMKSLCERYGLDDVDLECESLTDYGDGYYGMTIHVNSDKYMGLSRDQAFQFLYDAEYLDTEGTADMVYSVWVKSNGNTFYFDTKMSSGTGDDMGYVMVLGGGSAITGERGIHSTGRYKVTWSDWDYWK